MRSISTNILTVLANFLGIHYSILSKNIGRDHGNTTPPSRLSPHQVPVIPDHSRTPCSHASNPIPSSRTQLWVVGPMPQPMPCPLEPLHQPSHLPPRLGGASGPCDLISLAHHIYSLPTPFGALALSLGIRHPIPAPFWHFRASPPLPSRIPPWWIPTPGRTHIGTLGPHAWFEFKCELFAWVFFFFSLLIHLAVLYWLSTYAT